MTQSRPARTFFCAQRQADGRESFSAVPDSAPTLNRQAVTSLMAAWFARWCVVVLISGRLRFDRLRRGGIEANAAALARYAELCLDDGHAGSTLQFGSTIRFIVRFVMIPVDAGTPTRCRPRGRHSTRCRPTQSNPSPLCAVQCPFTISTRSLHLTESPSSVPVTGGRVLDTACCGT